MSPRNPSAAVVNMMRKTGCRRLIATRHSLGTLLDGIRTEFASSSSGVDEPIIDLEIAEPPALAYVYPELLSKETTTTPFVSYPKADERPANDAIMYYLHSSGSTGFPKPIPITYLTAVHWCITRTLFYTLETSIQFSCALQTKNHFHFRHQHPCWSMSISPQISELVERHSRRSIHSACMSSYITPSLLSRACPCTPPRPITIPQHPLSSQTRKTRSKSSSGPNRPRSSSSLRSWKNGRHRRTSSRS